jgi:hypothetical protein
MNIEENIKNGTFFSFIPRNLKIEGKSEFNVFPLNVLFASFTIKDNLRFMGSALYEPNLLSYKRDGDKWEMNYHNVYGGDGWLLITYDEAKMSYSGEKFVGGESVGMAFGTKWDGFFIHFTALGLAKGEKCMFEKVNHV